MVIVRAAFYMSNWDFALNEIVENGKAGLHYVEGPERYTVQDVASAFEAALGKPVELEGVNRENIEKYYLSLKFSKISAMSFTRMALKTISGNWPPLNKTLRGQITLQQYIEKLCIKPT